jgi:cytochrome P450
LSDAELVGQVAVLFGAAHMTTAHALCWTLFLLAQHPSVMQMLWAELQQDGPDDSAAIASAIEDGPPSIADTSKPLSLLENVIKESMRLLPASAYSQRINSEPVELGPFRLPRGTGIVFTPLVTHRLPEIYPQPDRFLPDRWIMLRPSPYAYHPFGAGARMCIGGPLALAIMHTALRKILTRFRLTVVPGATINAHVESTMLVPSDGVPMLVSSADARFTSAPIAGNIHELVDFDELPAACCARVDRAAKRPGVPRRPR